MYEDPNPAKSGKFGKNETTIIIVLILGILAVSAYLLETILVNKAITLDNVKKVEGLHFLQLKTISFSVLGLILLFLLLQQY